MTGRAVTKVVVFDLNQTFYKKSSKEEFYKFVCRKEPKRISYLLEMAYFTWLKNLNRMRQTEFKENFFNYLDKLPPEKVLAYAEEFWEQEFPRNFNTEIKKRLKIAKADGQEIFCATGGLEIYVEPLFKLFPVDGFAGTRTVYDGKTYKVVGEACKGEEKVRRVKEFYKDKVFAITESYSDKEEELFELTQRPFLVSDGQIEPFEKTGK